MFEFSATRSAHKKPIGAWDDSGGCDDDLNIKNFVNPFAGAASSCATLASVTSKLTTALPFQGGAGRGSLRLWFREINKARRQQL
jgi:hypothetical protein